MAEGLRELAPVLALFFTVSQFLGYFKWNNIDQVVAIQRRACLESPADQPMIIFVGVGARLISLLNLFLTSGSADAVPAGAGAGPHVHAARHPAGEHPGAVPHRRRAHQQPSPR